ncbi:hypothetical protein PM082_018766 [Marasmius tenuissimus]|nr:hypothetical protein PM082_018766 [Marasmius tenuissimus]
MNPRRLQRFRRTLESGWHSAFDITVKATRLVVPHSLRELRLIVWRSTHVYPPSYYTTLVLSYSSPSRGYGGLQIQGQRVVNRVSTECEEIFDLDMIAITRCASLCVEKKLLMPTWVILTPLPTIKTFPVVELNGELYPLDV